MTEKELHPIINDVLDFIRKRTEEVNGKRVVVEEFVLQDEHIPKLIEKLRAINTESEQREAILSLFAFGMMVEKQGYKKNAKIIRDLGKEFGSLFFELNRTILFRSMEREPQWDKNFNFNNLSYIDSKRKLISKSDNLLSKPWTRGTAFD